MKIFIHLIMVETREFSQFNALTLYGHIETAEQQTIIQQFGDWYTGRWWVGCYIWYSEEGPGRAAAPPKPLIAVPNVTAHPSTASVPTSYQSIEKTITGVMVKVREVNPFNFSMHNFHVRGHYESYWPLLCGNPL